MRVVFRSVKANVDHAVALLNDADIKGASKFEKLVELIVGEFVELLFPTGFAVGEAVQLIARLAVVVFPYGDVEIIIVGIVEGVVE